MMSVAWRAAVTMGLLFLAAIGLVRGVKAVVVDGELTVALGWRQKGYRLDQTHVRH